MGCDCNESGVSSRRSALFALRLVRIVQRKAIKQMLVTLGSPLPRGSHKTFCPKVTAAREEGRLRPPIRAGRIRLVPSPAGGLVLSFVIHGQIFRKSPRRVRGNFLVHTKKVHPQVLRTSHLLSLPHCDPRSRSHTPPLRLGLRSFPWTPWKIASNRPCTYKAD